MTFKWPLRIASVVCLLIAFWDFSSKLPGLEQVFNSSKVVELENAQATTFSPPRGTPRIQLVDSTKKIYVVDCLTNSRLCDAGLDKSDLLVKGRLVKLQHDFYWPVEAVYASGELVGQHKSQLLYEIFRDRDSQFYKIWLALSLAFLGFSIWFGSRSMFTEAKIAPK